MTWWLSVVGWLLAIVGFLIWLQLGSIAHALGRIARALEGDLGAPRINQRLGDIEKAVRRHSAP